MRMCKKNYLLVGLMLVLALSVSNANPVQSNERVSSVHGVADSANGELSIAKVQFTKPLEIEYAISLFHGMSIDIALIESHYEIGHRTLTEFYSLPSHTSPHDIDAHSYEQEYKRHRRAMMEAVLESSQKLDPSINFSFDMPNSMEAELDDTDSVDILVNGFTLVGDNDELSGLVLKNNIQSLEISTVNSIREKINAKERSQSVKHDIKDEHPNWEPDTNWEPDVGVSIVDSNYGYRYSLQYMGWYSNNFNGNATYEHDFFLNNYNNNPGTYLNPKSTSYPGCFPVSTYATTTWPPASYPYLDTRLSGNLIGCENEEIPYTIGAAKADEIPSGTWQYTYIATQPGNANWDKFKLQGQKGYRLPSWCYTTWCSFGDATVKLVPAWNSGVPGMVSW